MVVTYTGNQKIRFYAVPLSPWFFGGISHFWSLYLFNYYICCLVESWSHTICLTPNVKKYLYTSGAVIGLCMNRVLAFLKMIASLPATCSQNVRTIDILLISMGFVLTVTLQMSAWYTACQEFEIYF